MIGGVRLVQLDHSRYERLEKKFNGQLWTLRQKWYVLDICSRAVEICCRFLLSLTNPTFSDREVTSFSHNLILSNVKMCRLKKWDRYDMGWNFRLNC